MIITNFLKLKGVLVATRSGDILGILKDFQLDLDTLKVTSLIIKPSGLLKNLMMEEVVIPVQQVVEITIQKIIVEDSVANDRGRPAFARATDGQASLLASDFGKNIVADTGSMSSSDQPQ